MMSRFDLLDNFVDNPDIDQEDKGQVEKKSINIIIILAYQSSWIRRSTRYWKFDTKVWRHDRQVTSCVLNSHFSQDPY